MNIKKLCYELYKIDWKNSHGITYQMEMDEVKNFYMHFESHDIYDSFKDYLFECGYVEGIIYVCFDEFCENEYLDETYMCELLDDKKLIQYYYQDIILNAIRNAQSVVEGELELNLKHDGWWAMDYKENLGGSFLLNNYNDGPIIPNEMIKNLDVNIRTLFDNWSILYVG